MSRFTIGDADFLLDGRPHQIISGALHYFRIHPGHWADRIHKARLMGLNTIETYVAWNAHEPRRGQWDVTGANDIARFLDLIAEEGMNAIVRPGPYICAEWHNGGLPVWLTGTPGIRLRRSDPVYLNALEDYLRRVYEIVAPRQIDHGGNVILVQIENEYGAYGSDKDYLAELVRITRDAGINVPLTTVDQPEPAMLRNGTLPDLHTTGSFGSRAIERLETLRGFQPTGPLMCSEFWNGWFDSWGDDHHTTSAAESAAELDALLGAGASVNIYMFHGGTNFGLTNGANDNGAYAPIITSYDYDAPLDEAGNPTAKFDAFREVIARYASVPDEYPRPAPSSPSFEVALVDARRTGTAATTPIDVSDPPSFDDLEHIESLMRYQTLLPSGFTGGEMTVVGIRDRAWVSVDDVKVGVLSRSHDATTVHLPAGERLSLLVEDQGRVNYGKRLGESKGIVGPVLVNETHCVGWTVMPILLEDAAAHPELTVLDGSFELEHPSDLFLDTAGWGDGYVYVNDLMLGRYSHEGPQRTLYVPGPATREGRNTIRVIELDSFEPRSAVFRGRAELSGSSAS